MANWLLLFVVVFAAASFQLSYAECKNGCSGHGRCTVYDMCICNRNWQSNDCSERVCGYGLSFVDSPKGDLDASGSIDGPDDVVIVNSDQFPYGTTEQFPDMRDSDLKLLDQSAHWYSECSNAGICNRKTGECECFDGFEGAVCNQLQCPGEEYECSGHGICQRLKTLAQSDYSSSYQLWGKDTIKGCLCDKGYYGGDCSMRYCKYGLDPLYLDDISTVQVPSYFFAVLTTARYYDLTSGYYNQTGHYSIVIYDRFKQSYHTAPIASGASCDEIIEAIESLPSTVIPPGYTKCYKSSFREKDPLADSNEFRIKYGALYRFYLSGSREFKISTSKAAFQSAGFVTSYAENKTSDPFLTGDLYYLQFYGNLGEFPQPAINLYASPSSRHRPSLVSSSGTGQVIAKVWTNGQQSGDIDYFADHCEGVRVQVKTVSADDTYLFGYYFAPAKFNKCLGSSDFDIENNSNDFQNWDYGSIYYPHIIKLVRHVDDYRDSGFIVVVYYDPTISGFDTQSGFVSVDIGQNGGYRLMHPFHPLDDKEDVIYDVYTTKGTLHWVGPSVEAVFDFADNLIYATNISYDLSSLSTFPDGDISCESAGIPFDASPEIKRNCLDKSDLFLLLDPLHSKHNPAFLNLHNALSIRSQNILQYADSIESTYKSFANVSLSRRNLTANYKRHVVRNCYYCS